MNRKLLSVVALLSAAALTFSGCAKPPSENTDKSETKSDSKSADPEGGSGKYKACMVSDSGGFDDKSFNETSYKGLMKAKDELGVETGQVESSTTSDFAQNIGTMIDAKCDIIITVGFLLGDATVAAAKANPDVQFAIVDNVPKGAEKLKNLKPLVFNTAESSFAAGYLAAAMTSSGTVGTFGGAKIPTVTIFMDGFAQGVEYYNKQKSKSVKVLGWDVKKQDGSFVPAAGGSPFENKAGGKSVGTSLVSQGADILFPVAGPAGEGALQVAKASGGKVSAIWVDADGCESASSYCPSIMTSVYKGMDTAVFEAIKSVIDGDFSSDPFVGTLQNEGTGLSPYHEFDSKIPDDIKSEIDAIKADIISGKIKITSAAQPK